MIKFSSISDEKKKFLEERTSHSFVSQFIKCINTMQSDESVMNIAFLGSDKELNKRITFAIANYFDATLINKGIREIENQNANRVLYFENTEDVLSNDVSFIQFLGSKSDFVVLSFDSNKSVYLEMLKMRNLIAPFGLFEIGSLIPSEKKGDESEVIIEPKSSIELDPIVNSEQIVFVESPDQTRSSIESDIDTSAQFDLIQKQLSQFQSMQQNNASKLQELKQLVDALVTNNSMQISRIENHVREQHSKPQLLNDTLSSKLNYQQDAINKIDSDLTALAAMLVDEPKQNEMLMNMQFNINQIAQGLSLAKDYEQLRRENEAYRADTNMKNFRKYGIDGLIKLYSNICARIFKIDKGIEEDDEEKLDRNTLLWMLRRMERQFKALDIKIERSEPNEPMDESRMELFGDDEYEESIIIVDTNNPTLDHMVERCVVPAFVWNIPTVTSAPGNKWYLQNQKVCIYRYKSSNELY